MKDWVYINQNRSVSHWRNYRTSKRIGNRSMMVMSASFLYRNFEFSRGVFGITFTVLPIILGLEKIMVRTLQVSLRRHGLLLRNVVIVGCGENAWKYFEVISSKLSLGFRPVGFLSVKEEGINEKFPYIKNILGTTHEIARIIRKYAVDEVMIALPSSIHSRVLDIITQCEREIVKFNVMPDMFEIMISKVTIQEIEGMPFVTLKEPKLLTWWYFIKRIFDVIGAVSGLVVFAPFLIIIAICIKLDSKGPVLYLQKRVGIDGKKFFMFKFRTMHIDAEQHTGPVWANKEDDRRTRIGTFLRKTNLDELPQLFNVLRSDMSLVGPRPERPFFVNKFKHNIPHYMSRHRVKSGITGWAQVNGLRGNTSLEERVKYDLFYIENWSFMLDIKILLMTFFSHKNAY
ncbi:MAG: undecaprenyl-phosphate glucose phosphotransferase [bacterium]|nr:undecaprenyl-phosphate glucose phosphotransferase [bacterium]